MCNFFLDIYICVFFSFLRAVIGEIDPEIEATIDYRSGVTICIIYAFALLVPYCVVRAEPLGPLVH